MPWKTDPAKGHLMGFVLNAADLAVLDGATGILTGPVTRSFLGDATRWFGSVDLPVKTYP